jgi:hypothetical protein
MGGVRVEKPCSVQVRKLVNHLRKMALFFFAPLIEEQFTTPVELVFSRASSSAALFHRKGTTAFVVVFFATRPYGT